jgi:photosystem II stability/assembly factor-like uncharacterized protein
MTRALSLLLLSAAFTPAADPPAWTPTLGDLVKTEKAGFGGLCGVVVDPAKGTVWINVSDRGFYRSDDQAKTFRRCGEKQPKGRTETPGCLMLDPTGRTQRLMTALVYGNSVSVSDDGGETWKSLDAKAEHVDWFAADWTAKEPKFVLALKHEKDGLLLASHDGGGSFAEVGKGYGPGWVFDDKTAVVAEAKTKEKPKPNLVRTTDGGKTWQASGEYSPVGQGSNQALPRWHDGKLYWLVDGALIASKDAGETWKKVSDVTKGRFGPVFGRDAQHLFLLTNDGVIESADAGATWGKPIPPPKEMKGVNNLLWLAYDPKGGVLYLMGMGSDLYKLERGK